VKGMAYAIEAILATILVVIFLFGAIDVGEVGQDWSDFKTQVASNDLSHSLEMSGRLENFSKRGETGSIQTAVNFISDRNLEVSGSVSNLPTAPIVIAYATPDNKQTESDVVEVKSGDRCHNNLSMIKAGSNGVGQNPIYRSDGNLEGKYNARLYFSNTSNSSGYDTLWIDNGTKNCQFDPTTDRYTINQIFNWKNNTVSNFYEFENITVSANEVLYYNASQAVNIRRHTHRTVNEIQTDVEFDLVDKENSNPTSPEFTHIVNMSSSKLIINETDNSRVNDKPPGREYENATRTYYEGLDPVNGFYSTWNGLNGNNELKAGKRVAELDKKDTGGYSPDQLRTIVASIYWTADQRRSFEATERSGASTTQVVGGIKNYTFIPYVVNLRWVE
jgi:hypothetical protein